MDDRNIGAGLPLEGESHVLRSGLGAGDETEKHPSFRVRPSYGRMGNL